jgi:hypothetical protein
MALNPGISLVQCVEADSLMNRLYRQSGPLLRDYQVPHPSVATLRVRSGRVKQARPSAGRGGLCGAGWVQDVADVAQGDGIAGVGLCEPAVGGAADLATVRRRQGLDGTDGGPRS